MSYKLLFRHWDSGGCSHPTRLWLQQHTFPCKQKVWKPVPLHVKEIPIGSLGKFIPLLNIGWSAWPVSSHAMAQPDLLVETWPCLDQTNLKNAAQSLLSDSGEVFVRWSEGVPYEFRGNITDRINLLSNSPFIIIHNINIFQKKDWNQFSDYSLFALSMLCKILFLDLMTLGQV